MGSTGSSVVGGTLSDLWTTRERGPKMSLLSLVCFLGNSESPFPSVTHRIAHPSLPEGVAPLAMSWVEARPGLEWRWIQWIQVIMFGVCLPFIMMIPETREGVILRRQAARKRKHSTAAEGDAQYLARSEVAKPHLIELIKASSLRPICTSRPPSPHRTDANPVPQGSSSPNPSSCSSASGPHSPGACFTLSRRVYRSSSRGCMDSTSGGRGWSTWRWCESSAVKQDRRKAEPSSQNRIASFLWIQFLSRTPVPRKRGDSRPRGAVVRRDGRRNPLRGRVLHLRMDM